ncbi:MAG: DUF58 domain-containing protein [Opitutales bacterium]|nr:DUF58 domain-containing protein [Opitutales bacterium]
MPVQASQSLLDPANLTRIEPFPLLAKTAVEGFLSGMHRSVFHGFGSEFLQYRHYTQGEDLKYVDWKLFARSDRLHSKVFQEETNMNVYLVVDASASMDYQGEQASCSKARYAAMIAACFAYMAAKQGDNISLLCYNEQINGYLEPGHRNQQLQRVLLELARSRPRGEARHEQALDFLENQVGNRGLVILLSDMLEGENVLPRRLSRLRLLHCDCIALQILDPDELRLPRRPSARFEDLESQAEVLTSPERIAESYDAQMQGFLETLKTGFQREQVDTLRLLTTQNLGAALAAYLHHREKRA